MSDPLPSLSAASTPAQVKKEMADLRAALDLAIPPKRDAARNLLIGTWNIKAFADLNELWTTKDKGPKRDWRGLWAIAETVSRFDVVAIQEAKGTLKALRTLMKTLGNDWSFLMTDVTRGQKGNNERLVFLFDRTRVQLSGLACELVIPEDRKKIGADALDRQFARTPYAVGFRAGSETFVLVTLHVDYGKSAAGRIPELKAIADWMRDWAKEVNDWEQNLIVLGDFNIDRHDDPLWKAFTSTGLTVPVELNEVPRAISVKNAKKKDKYYDQIAWFVTGGKEKLSLNYRTGGGFDFVPHLYQDIKLPLGQLQHRVSDHYPLWVEFTCR